MLLEQDLNSYSRIFRVIELMVLRLIFSNMVFSKENSIRILIYSKKFKNSFKRKKKYFVCLLIGFFLLIIFWHYCIFHIWLIFQISIPEKFSLNLTFGWECMSKHVVKVQKKKFMKICIYLLHTRSIIKKKLTKISNWLFSLNCKLFINSNF